MACDDAPSHPFGGERATGEDSGVTLTAAPETQDLLPAVTSLRDEVGTTSLPFDLPGVRAAERGRTELLRQLDDYILPRLASLDAPLLAVVGGSTGAGKSTLVNSLVRAVVSAPGVLRPTTRSPVLVHHPDDERWFTPTRILPDLARATGGNAVERPGDDAAGHLVDPAAGARPPRRPRHRLRRPRRTVSWPASCSVRRICGSSSRRRPGMRTRCPGSCSARRRNAGPPWPSCSTGSPRARSPSSASTSGRCSRSRASAPLPSSRWRSRRSRTTACCRTTRSPGCTRGSRRWPRTRVPALSWSARRCTGALDSLDPRIQSLVDASAAQVSARKALEKAALTSYASATAAVETGMSDGSLLRGEVLARWQEFVGHGGVLPSGRDHGLPGPRPDRGRRSRASRCRPPTSTRRCTAASPS